MLVRWDPLTEFDRIHRSFLRPWHSEEAFDFRPSVDILEEDNAIKVKADIAGVNPDDIKIGLEKNVLTISGERKLENKEEKEGYHRVERHYGSFRRSFLLPDNVDKEGVDADYKDGVLTVTLPKNPESAAKEIKVKAN